MNFKNTWKLFLLSLSILILTSLSTGLKSMTFLWMVILLVAFKKLSNHFISLLITLEIFSLLSMLVASSLTKLTNSVSLMFILMSLSVGEGVLGLALLVKFARETSSEQTSTALL